MPAGPALVQEWIARSGAGDAAATQRLLERLYDDLRRLARRQLQRERSDHTLQATALVHEAWLALAGQSAKVESDGHLLALAAIAMRRVLAHHAEKKRAAKRGGHALRVTLAPDAAVTAPDFDLLDLDDALSALAELDPRKVQVVELRFFAGLSVPETAAVLGVSAATVKRDFELARAWLLRRLGASER